MRLPGFFVKISPIGETLAAMEQEMGHLEAETTAKNDQLAVSTADTGLALWEQDYGLSSAGDLPTRRGRVRAAMTAGAQPFTLTALRQLAITVGGAGGVAVEEDFANARVVIRAVFPDADGIPPWLIVVIIVAAVVVVGGGAVLAAILLKKKKA